MEFWHGIIILAAVAVGFYLIIFAVKLTSKIQKSGSKIKKGIEIESGKLELKK